MGSITRPIGKLLGLGYLNLEDALAGEFSAIFAAQPSNAPLTALLSDVRAFDRARAKLVRPKNKEEADDLLDIVDSRDIQKQWEKIRDTLRHARAAQAQEEDR
jgi:hypothetical protein